jgi:hypothetical protein
MTAIVSAVAVRPFVVAWREDQGAVKQAKMPELHLGLFIRAKRRARFEVTDVNRKIGTFLVDGTDQRFVGCVVLGRLTVGQVTQGHKVKRLGRHNLGCYAQERSHAPAFAETNCAFIHLVFPFSKTSFFDICESISQQL